LPNHILLSLWIRAPWFFRLAYPDFLLIPLTPTGNSG
jgi:hypothetical protein